MRSMRPSQPTPGGYPGSPWEHSTRGMRHEVTHVQCQKQEGAPLRSTLRHLMTVVPLSSSSELVERLPFSAVTVVLLTAFWSFESDDARHALNTATTLVDCGSLSVSYYEVPVSIHELHSPPSAVPMWAAKPWSDAHRNALAAHNVTNLVPWFPCIRVFVHGEDGIVPHTHVDTFAPGALANHIEQHCRRSRRELRLLDGGAVEPEEEPRSRLASLSRYTTPISRDRFAREMNKDLFKSLGVLFLVRGGVQAILEAYEDRWDAVARAINEVNIGKVEMQDLRQRWVVSIVDTEREWELAERNDVDPNGEPAVVLVDVAEDRSEVRGIPEYVKWESVRSALLRFERGSGGAYRRSEKMRGADPHRKHRVADRRARTLSFFEPPSAWRPYFSSECSVCLQSYVSSNYTSPCFSESVVIVVFYARWCGFSQRVLPVYNHLQKLAQRGAVGAVVVLVEDMEEVPGFLDEMVDGLPTVVVLRDYGGGRQTVQEFEGPHRMDAILGALGEDVVGGEEWERGR